jgi:Fe-S-cluster-containing dehydrogenase component
MAQKILIDMIKLRAAMVENSALTLPEGLFYTSVNSNGLKTIRELATFKFTCRKCEDAPCIAVCPADALEKDKDGVISRYTNLCISCKSCVTICPFGTMMTDFFRYHLKKDLFYDLTEQKDIDKFIMACPPGTVTITDLAESPSDNIFRLNERVLIKDHIYTSEKQ